MRTLLAANGGGHLTQLVNLRHRFPFDTGDVTWFTFDTPQSRSMLEGEEVVFAHHAPPRDWLAAARNARLAFAMCRHFRFDTAVSTGASIAVSALPVARRFGARAYYIESAARVEGPSVSGRMLATLPGIRTACQYRSWAGGRWIYAGSVFDSFEPGPVRPSSPVTRVVVTLGSQDGYPFDRLVARLAQVLPPDAEVLWQTGTTDGSAYGLATVASMPAAELEAAMAQADVVIAHAGVGSALSAVLAGRHPILVPRRVSAGEHIDDHQLQIASELVARGIATSCAPDEIDLAMVEGAASRTVVRNEDAPQLRLDP